MNTVARYAALAAFVLSVAGCKGAAADGLAWPSYDDFADQASNIDAFDREECRLAQTRARSPQVRALAAQMLARIDGQGSGARTVPDALTAELRVRAYRLRFAQGGEFDAAFVADQIYSRERALASRDSPPLRAELARLRDADGVAVAEASR